jgi:hypothetical protein
MSKPFVNVYGEFAWKKLLGFVAVAIIIGFVAAYFVMSSQQAPGRNTTSSYPSPTIITPPVGGSEGMSNFYGTIISEPQACGDNYCADFMTHDDIDYKLTYPMAMGKPVGIPVYVYGEIDGKKITAKYIYEEDIMVDAALL